MFVTHKMLNKNSVFDDLLDILILFQFKSKQKHLEVESGAWMLIYQLH